MKTVLSCMNIVFYFWTGFLPVLLRECSRLIISARPATIFTLRPVGLTEYLEGEPTTQWSISNTNLESFLMTSVLFILLPVGKLTD